MDDADLQQAVHEDLQWEPRADAAHGAPYAGLPHVVAGYDGSAPASRALDAVVRLLKGPDRLHRRRVGGSPVKYRSSTVRLSADAIVEMEAAFDELEPDLRAQAAGQLRGRGADWEFERRQGVVVEELIAVAAGIGDARQSVVIVIGSSSHAADRVVGSVAVSLARHAPVPLLFVPWARGAAGLGPDRGSAACGP
jgi:nucleotide-binding universal stress UspA family protein